MKLNFLFKRNKNIPIKIYSYDTEELREIAAKCFFCDSVVVEFVSNHAILLIKINDLDVAISTSQIQDFCKQTKELVPYYYGFKDFGCLVFVGDKGLGLRFSLLV